MTKKAMLAGAAAAAVLAAAGQAAAADVEKAATPAVLQAHVYLPITKIDAKTRTIEARITDETVDSAGEICDYETSAPLFKAWSDNAAAKTAGKSKGNVRAMHQPIAAGKLTDLTCDDATKSIDCVLKVVDDAEWEKVEEGLYTGLSLGGNYVGKKWKDPATGAYRYTVDPVEVSLVDVPCNPSATFKYAAADGSECEKAFKPWTPTNAEVAAKAEQLAEAAGDKAAWVDHMDAAKAALIVERGAVPFTMEDIQNAEIVDLTEEDDDGPAPEPAEKVAPADTDWGVEQVFQVKADGSVHASKKVALEHVAKLQAVEEVGGSDLLAQAIAKAKAAITGEPEAGPAEGDKVSLKGMAVTPGLEDAFEALKAVRAESADGEAVEKSLYGAGRFIEYVSALIGLQNDAAWEAEYERDGSTIPAQMAKQIKQLGAVALAMVQEELAEDLGRLREVKTAAATPEVVKAVLAGIEADEALCQKAAKRAPKAKAEDEPDLEVTKLQAANKALEAQVEKAAGALNEVAESVNKMRSELDAAKTKIADLEKAPAPPPVIAPGSTVVTRADGSQIGVTKQEAEIAIKALVLEHGPQALVQMAMKVAQQNPMAVVGGGEQALG